MKKGLLTVLLIALVGCTSAKDAIYQEQLNNYETSYRALLNADRFQTESRFYSIVPSIVQDEDGYKYVLILDDARIAMYDVEVMVVENQEPFDSSNKMLPSAGIFDGEYTFIPNQVRESNGFKEGIILGRLQLEKPTVSIRVSVSWKNYTKLETFKEVFEFDLKVEDSTDS